MTSESEARPAPQRPEIAAAHVVRDVAVAAPDELVGTVVARLSESNTECLDAVFVVDASRRLAGAVRLPDLYRAAPEQSLGDVLDPLYPRVGELDDQEHLAAEALTRRAAAVAVVDGEGRLIGAVPALALLEILRHEHVEDLQRLAGIQRERMRDWSALEAPPLRRARHRLPWLLFGLAGSMVSAMVVARFEKTLEEKLTIAFFVPAIVYLADAIGTQTEAIVVRGLSLSRLSLRHLLFDELRTGLLIGLVLGALSLPIVAFGFGDAALAAAVALAIVIAGGLATTIGLLLPWLLQKLGSDPAFGSGPVATVLQDILSLLVYFFVAALILG